MAFLSWWLQVICLITWQPRTAWLTTTQSQNHMAALPSCLIGPSLPRMFAFDNINWLRANGFTSLSFISCLSSGDNATFLVACDGTRPGHEWLCLGTTPYLVSHITLPFLAPPRLGLFIYLDAFWSCCVLWKADTDDSQVECVLRWKIVLTVENIHSFTLLWWTEKTRSLSAILDPGHFRGEYSEQEFLDCYLFCHSFTWTKLFFWNIHLAFVYI